jgi:hypothetical protein
MGVPETSSQEVNAKAQRKADKNSRKEKLSTSSFLRDLSIHFASLG